MIDFTVDILEESEYMYWKIKNKLIVNPTDQVFNAFGSFSSSAVGLN